MSKILFHILGKKQKNFKTKTKQHEENHSMEEGETNERTEVNPCEDNEHELSNPQIQTSQHRRSERKIKGIPRERFAFFANPERIKEPKSWNDVLKMENPYEK
ncbi:hypothetical protein AVEN_110956-1 [Araneus ventricosus]|uniref:Uncharacterized protein n=1 Tax=Araneus ventricosus TaxID=182803 RepID=A0A4Y2HDA8_ARAVE|nr:hypothetical protein AVEN_110956-1 [Araneus ventricosus]